MAKRKKKKASSKGSSAEPIQVLTDLPTAQVKVKRRRTTAVMMEPEQRFTATMNGPGKLAVIVYQPVRGSRAKGKVDVEISLDGESAGSVSLSKGKRKKSVKVYGAGNPKVSKPKSTSLKLESGEHSIEVVAAGSSNALVELQFYPEGAKSPSPVEVVAAPPPPEPEPEPEPDAPPPPDVPPPPDGGAEGIGAVAIDAPPQVDNLAEVQARIDSGEIRDGLVGAYASVTIRNSNDGSTEAFSVVTTDRPYTFVAKGPGDVTVRLHRMVTAGAPSQTETLTILENDVLLRTFDIATAVDAKLSVEGKPELQVMEIKEYKLSLGPKVSRFGMQPSESATQGMAIQYSFTPREADETMALTLDLGSDMGFGQALGAETTITEVSVRETVTTVEVEKVVRVGGDEFLGVSLGGGVVSPIWRGLPAYTADLEIRLSLPFAQRMFAFTIGFGGQLHNMSTSVADPEGAALNLDSRVIAVPMMAGLVARWVLADVFALYVGGQGGVYFVYASRLGDASVNQNGWVWAAGATAGIEVKAGPGWLALGSGYTYAPTSDFDLVLDGYSPGGFPATLKYRLGF